MIMLRSIMLFLAGASVGFSIAQLLYGKMLRDKDRIIDEFLKLNDGVLSGETKK